MNINKLKKIVTYILAIIVFIYLNFPSEDIGDLEKVIITKVVDGDTFYAGDQKIRIIGVNTPEFTKAKEVYGYEAKKYAEDILLNRVVYLEKDESDVDRYNRSLRYIWIEVPDEINRENIEKYNFSGMLLKSGLGRTHTFKPDTKYLDYFKDIERDARNSGLGIWSLDDTLITRGNEYE